MNNFDKHIKNIVGSENQEVPKIIIDSIDDTLENLPNFNKNNHTKLILKRTLSAVACLIVTFLFVLPNISVTYAKSLEKVPVIGKFSSLITFRNYTYNNNRYDLDISEPYIDDDIPNANSINVDVNSLTNSLVSKFYNDLDLQSNGYGSIYMDYETLIDNDNWFTLKLSVTETAASSNSYYKFYHIDKQKQIIVELKDLFIDDSYKSVINNEIKTQMKSQMQNDENIVYWTNEAEFSESFSSIDDNQNYYWDDEFNLVIVFDKYEVGPGSIGIPEFVISKSILDEYLKLEYRNL